MRWEDIVDRHGPLVWRSAYRLLGNDADAAVCYQDAFAAALVIARREAVRNWPALLRGIATTNALDRLRQRAKRAARAANAANDGGLDSAASPGLEPSAVAEGEEFLESVRAALAQLPAPQAEAF